MKILLIEGINWKISFNNNKDMDDGFIVSKDGIICDDLCDGAWYGSIECACYAILNEYEIKEDICKTCEKPQSECICE